MSDTVSTPSRRMAGKMVLSSLVGAAAISTLGKSASAQGTVSLPGSRIDTIKARGALRVAAPVGEPPYFVKDLKSGTLIGGSVEMAKDIAALLKVDVEFVDSTWGDQIIQLQTDKVDIGMASSITPARALSVTFTDPIFEQGFGLIVRGDNEPKTWEDINRPEVKVAVDMGSTQESAVRQFAPNATILSVPKRDEVILAMQSGRVDCACFAAIPGLTTMKKVPNIGRFILLEDPVVAMPTSLVIAKDVNTEWRDFLNAWVAYNKSTGQLRSWLRGGLALSGILPEDIPASVTL